ncbi:hypothetical protein [Nocardia otitidiscaviarum]|uniref:hypothetical protein n=1 Tax=Nocardia otitidiscaviarum TaxID=1823 RepID=UPI0004A6C611|nr:hypothetical protein [Nocardia otitidiscaviarum]
MSDIEQETPRLRYRLWDTEYRLIGEWLDRLPADEIIDGRNLTIDYPNGRWSGRVFKGELTRDDEFLTRITLPDNPFVSTRNSATRVSDLISSLGQLQSVHGDVLVTVIDPYDGKRYPAVLEVEVDEFDRFESICVRPGVWDSKEAGSTP